MNHFLKNNLIPEQVLMILEKMNWKGSLLWLLLIVSTFSCNSRSGKGPDFAGFFGGSEEVDIERLRYDLTEDIIDSAGIKEFLIGSDFPPELIKTFLSFYKNRDYIPAWIDEDGITEMGEELLSALEKSEEHGLNPEDYKFAYLQHIKKKLDRENAPLKEYQKLDKEFTAAYLKYANHLLRGRIEPTKYDSTWKTNRREKNLAEVLQKALEKEEVSESFQQVEPQYEGYKELKDALAFYEELIEKNIKWTSLPKDLKLKPGDSSVYVPQISSMLVALGDLKSKKKGNIYDEELVNALISFQERNGLEPDSIIAGKTISMLNVPPAERAAQIKLNMERFRWLPEKPQGRHVVVNLPEYKAYLYEGNEILLSMKVIVGKAYESTTPVFNDTMEYITFSPTWAVPPSIATEEMLPKLLEDPGYLAKNDLRLYASWAEDAEELDPWEINWKKVEPEAFPYKIVQNPGEGNSLGRVKFMFPNKMNIYLHDTPADHLFNKTERDFSHGCIRVEKPVDFAEMLLKDQKISRSTIEEYMRQDEPVEVPLMKKVPVLIDYRTAWVDEDGRLNFREDIYGHDRKQLGTLKKAVAETTK